MSKNEKDTKKNESKLEGLKVVGGKEGYNPAKEKEVEEEVFTSPVKIGDKEYIIKPLSMLDIKKLNIEKKKLKKDDDIATYDYTFYTLLTVIKKWNPEAKDMTVDQFEELVDVDDFERVQKAIVQIAGLKKYFKQGDSGK
ncbi:hypothetical protein ES703_85125 [subsurface metagenome]